MDDRQLMKLMAFLFTALVLVFVIFWLVYYFFFWGFSQEIENFEIIQVSAGPGVMIIEIKNQVDFDIKVIPSGIVAESNYGVCTGPPEEVEWRNKHTDSFVLSGNCLDAPQGQMVDLRLQINYQNLQTRTIHRQEGTFTQKA